MPFKPLRKDLTETTRRCDFCPKFLTSLKAYVLEDDVTGEVAYAGPKCAEKNIGANYTLAKIPDLTKFTTSSNYRDLANGESRGGGRGGDLSDPYQHALEYLMLREEKLALEMKTSYSVLNKYYIKSKVSPLTEAEVLHVNNIEAKAPESLRLSNLQRCYNYLFWIDVGIEKLPAGKNQFLSSVRRDLISRLEISKSQKDGVNKWLMNISGVPQLK